MNIHKTLLMLALTFAVALTACTGVLERPVNPNPEVRKLQHDAAEGNAEAQNKLGDAYYNRVGGLDKDIWRSDLNLGDTLYPDGHTPVYPNDRGVPWHYIMAAQWWEKAAEQGNADAQNKLGVAYHNAQVVTIHTLDNLPGDNDALAVKWWQKSAEQGNAEAQNNLGTAYYNGWGGRNDENLAAMWWQKSASQGNNKAKRNLANTGLAGRGRTGVLD